MSQRYGMAKLPAWPGFSQSEEEERSHPRGHEGCNCGSQESRKDKEGLISAPTENDQYDCGDYRRGGGGQTRLGEGSQTVQLYRDAII